MDCARSHFIFNITNVLSLLHTTRCVPIMTYRGSFQSPFAASSFAKQFWLLQMNHMINLACTEWEKVKNLESNDLACCTRSSVKEGILSDPNVWTNCSFRPFVAVEYESMQPCSLKLGAYVSLLTQIAMATLTKRFQSTFPGGPDWSRQG